MRDLVFSDVFTVIRILKKAGISEQARAIFAEIGANASEKEVGAKFLFMCLENLGKVENELAEFLGDLKGIEPDVVKNMRLDEMAELLREFIGHSGFKSFFSTFSGLMK
jgi:hypothetical protein